jgi:lysozyme family protein
MPGKHHDLDSDWRLEGFNGYGYRLYRGIHSPYLWAGTNHYERGKTIADRVHSATAISTQAGSAGLLKLLG